MKNPQSQSKKMVWTGRIISGICILFLIVDAVMKLLNTKVSIEGSAQIGWPEDKVVSIGFMLLICTILYVIPGTAILGAILLTAYLGGATAIMLRAGNPGHPYFFPVFFGILVWLGLFLRDSKLREMIPLKK
jgi:hypothetical protein